MLCRGELRWFFTVLSVNEAHKLFQATAYGQCIMADYNFVHRDKCVKEFMKLKDCYLVWPS